MTIGGLITLDALSRHAADPRATTPCWPKPPESVATPQIRNVGTLAGNVCQRPWCWYFRNGFPCFKNGGTTVLFGHRREPVPRDLRRRPELHRPSVGHRAGAGGARRDVPHRRAVGRAHGAGGATSSSLPTAERGARERAGGRRSAGVGRAARAAARDAQHVSQGAGSRSLDARRRQRRGRARDGQRRLPLARASCSAASRRFRGGCPRSSSCWPASASRRSSRRRPARRPSPARRRCAKNAYKVPLTESSGAADGAGTGVASLVVVAHALSVPPRHSCRGLALFSIPIRCREESRHSTLRACATVRARAYGTIFATHYTSDKRENRLLERIPSTPRRFCRPAREGFPARLGANRQVRSLARPRVGDRFCAPVAEFVHPSCRSALFVIFPRFWRAWHSPVRTYPLGRRS